MKRAKHTETTIFGCPACITQAEMDRQPWDNSYFELFNRNPKKYERKHNAAISRNARNDAMRSLGMVRVKGSLGGTYWE